MATTPEPAETPPNWMAIRSDGLSFLQCLYVSASDPELIREFDRLRGTNLALRGAPIDLAVDQASGRLDSDLEKFSRFVWDVVFLRTPLHQPKSGAGC